VDIKAGHANVEFFFSFVCHACDVVLFSIDTPLVISGESVNGIFSRNAVKW
jgi:hypothetical protein